MVEGSLDGLARVNILEGGNLLAALGLMHLDHLPAVHDIDAALEALVLGNLVGISELEDLLVGSPVLDAGTSAASTKLLILSEERFVVEGIEVSALALVGTLRRVADHVAGSVQPTVLIVAVGAILGVNLVDEDVFVLSNALLHFIETLDGVNVVVEASGEHKGLVSVLLAVREENLVLLRHVLDNSLAGVDSGPVGDLRGDGAALHVKGLDMMMRSTEVVLRHDELALGISNEGHIPAVVLGLEELSEGSGVQTTYQMKKQDERQRKRYLLQQVLTNKKNVEISLVRRHSGLLLATTGRSVLNGTEQGRGLVLQGTDSLLVAHDAFERSGNHFLFI